MVGNLPGGEWGMLQRILLTLWLWWERQQTYCKTLDPHEPYHKPHRKPHRKPDRNCQHRPSWSMPGRVEVESRARCQRGGKRIETGPRVSDALRLCLDLVSLPHWWHLFKIRVKDVQRRFGVKDEVRKVQRSPDLPWRLPLNLMFSPLLVYSLARLRRDPPLPILHTQARQALYLPPLGDFHPQENILSVSNQLHCLTSEAACGILETATRLLDQLLGYIDWCFADTSPF